MSHRAKKRITESNNENLGNRHRGQREADVKIVKKKRKLKHMKQRPHEIPLVNYHDRK